MRTPTPDSKLYAWHARALAGDKPPITDQPECGWYKRRLVRGGPFVPVVIWCNAEVDGNGKLLEPEILRCKVGDIAFDPCDQWTFACTHPITQREYDHMMRVREWCHFYAPDDPVLDPKTPYDFKVIKPDF